MTSPRRFPEKVLAAVGDNSIIGIQAGTRPHRVIGIWAVVVARRVFVRSWSVRPEGWFRAFLEEPRGILHVDGRELRVRTVLTRSERLKDLVDRAYERKYDTPGSIQYVKDLKRAKSRNTTTELVPLRERARGSPKRPG